MFREQLSIHRVALSGLAETAFSGQRILYPKKYPPYPLRRGAGDKAVPRLRFRQARALSGARPGPRACGAALRVARAGHPACHRRPGGEVLGLGMKEGAGCKVAPYPRPQPLRRGVEAEKGKGPSMDQIIADMGRIFAAIASSDPLTPPQQGRRSGPWAASCGGGATGAAVEAGRNRAARANALARSPAKTGPQAQRWQAGCPGLTTRRAAEGGSGVERPAGREPAEARPSRTGSCRRPQEGAKGRLRVRRVSDHRD